MISSNDPDYNKSVKERAKKIGVRADARIFKEKRGDSNSVLGLIDKGISKEAILELSDDQLDKLSRSRLERDMLQWWKHNYLSKLNTNTVVVPVKEEEKTETQPAVESELVDQNVQVIPPEKPQQNQNDYVIAWQPVLVPKSVLQPFLMATSPVQLLN